MDRTNLNTSPKVAIVIPTYTRSDKLEKCLASIVSFCNPENIAVIVVANGASAETRTVYNSFDLQWHGKSRLIWYTIPLGYPKAVNRGIDFALTRSHETWGYDIDYMVLLNDDTELLEQPKNRWLEMLLEPFTDPTVGISGPLKRTDPDCNRDFLIFFCVMIARKVLDSIGLLDESFTIGYGEDIDYAIRAEKQGWKVAQVDRTFPIWHEESQTTHRIEGWEDHVLKNREIIKERYGKMKVLVVVANHGESPYLAQMKEAFSSFTNYEVNVITIEHADDPQMVPWLCRRKLFENRDLYDLYLYTENDILYSEENFDTFLELTKVLPEDKIVGFMRWENSPEGRFYPDWHGDFDWVAGSAFNIGDYQFAEFSNLHQAGFLCTRKQLNHAIDVAAYGPFLVPNRRHSPSRYDILARANTDFYDTGFTKVLSVTHFEKMLVHHLSDKYYGVYGTKTDKEMKAALIEILAHPEDFCRRCGHANVVWFAPSPLWNIAVRAKGHSEILCPMCFIQLAKDAGITSLGWMLLPERPVGDFHTPAVELAEWIGEHPKWSRESLIHNIENAFADVSRAHAIDAAREIVTSTVSAPLPTYSIIVPTYQHLNDCLIPCLSSVQKWTDLSNVEVIVVANGCDASTREYLAHRSDAIRYLWFDDPIGFTKATNAGIDAARGEYIIFLNNDCEVLSPYWISLLQQLWDMTPNAGVVGPSIEDAYSGQFCAFYCAMTSRAVIDRIGKLDEVFESGGEDIDFCRRAQRAGFQVRGAENVYDEHGERRYGIHFPVIHQGEVTVHEDPQFLVKREHSHALLRERYPKFSLIIPTYQHLDLLKRCLTSVIAHTDLSQCEVLVCANGCTEDTKDYVLSLGEPFILLWAEEQIGFTKATNIGIKEARGEYLVFLNNDTELQDNPSHKAREWLDLLEQPFRDNPKCGATGPLLFRGEGEGVSYDFLMMFCFCISRKVVEDCGILDEQFAPAGVEDIDYSLRLQEKGYDLVQVPPSGDVEWNPNVSKGVFPIFHQGNASYGEEGNWHEILKRNEEKLKLKWPEKFKGLGWLKKDDWAARHKWMKEVDQQVYYELFEVDVYRCLREELAGKTVIDIGANKGFFALKAIEMGAREVYSYEPVESIYQQLVESTKDFPQVTTVYGAVTDSVRPIRMYEDSWCSHVWGTEGPEVCCFRLSDLVVGKNDLVLKCDCEGSEYEIFYGSTKETIRRFETIYLEIHETPNPKYQYCGKELLAYLESLGYESHAGPQPGTWYGDKFVDSPISMYKLKRKPWVTVIVPTYQRHELLKEALDSVANQTYPFVEVIVVADGPDDEVAKIAHKYGYKYSFIEHEGNIGTGCKIAGIEQASTEYVCFLDDDNLLEPQYVEKLVSALTPEKQVAIGEVLMHRWRDGEEVTRLLPADEPIPTWHEIDSLNFLVNTEIAKQCKESWQQDPSLPVDQDYRFISECLKHTGYGLVEEVLGHHREIFGPSLISEIAPIQRQYAQYTKVFMEQMIASSMSKTDFQKPKVYDVFMYNGEESILEIRAEEISSVVDKFIIVEGNMTHSGQPKDYRFPKWRAEAYDVIYIQVDLTTIDYSQYAFDPAWVREHVQRDAARKVLADLCGPNDYVIVGDVDEIPRASAVRAYIDSNSDKVGVLVQSRHCYYLNYKCISTNEPQLNSKIFKYSMLGEFDLNAMRFSDQRNLMPTERIEDGGWHFTAIGGAEAVKLKLSEFAHVEYQHKIGDVEKLIAQGKDFYDAKTEYAYVPIDESYPQWVREHEVELTARGLIKAPPFMVNAERGPTLQGNKIMLDKGTQLTVGAATLADKSAWTVTAEVSTKDRYFTTLPMCLSAIATQTRKPDKLKIYDDGEQLDLREISPYNNLFKMLDELGIKWEVIKTPRAGQVTNHQHCLENCSDSFIWRVDDDEVPMPNCLETLLNTIRDYGRGGEFDTIGAVGGLVLHPGNIGECPAFLDGSLNDIDAGLNLAWYKLRGGVREVQHLYSTFLFRAEYARKAGGYPAALSAVGHREESILSHSLHRAGYKVLLTPDCITWHLRESSGGIRSFTDHSLWEHDEAIWQSYRKEWGMNGSKPTKVINLDLGLGDHYAFRSVLPEIRKRHADKELIIAACYPHSLEGENLKLISIADHKQMVGERYEESLLYRYLWSIGHQGSLAEGMVKFWG